MVALQISQKLAGTIEQEAQERGLSVGAYLQIAVKRERALFARMKIEQEQEWWMNLSLKQRAKYDGEFIAVHNKKVVDHDKDQKALYKRVRGKLGNIPVLLMPAEGPKEIRIYSPKLARS
jgi:hypothetical protein